MAMRLVTSSVFLALVAALLFTSLANAIEFEFVNLECDSDVREASKCYAGGAFNGDVLLTGTYVCGRRTVGGLPGFAWNAPSTTCVGTVLGQVIGYAGDICGCCEGECPKLCSCVCDPIDDKVMVFRKGSWSGESTECLSRGKASRQIGRSSDYTCVPDDQCESYLSPGNSSSTVVGNASTSVGTDYEQTEEPEEEEDFEGMPELEAEEPEEETAATGVGPARERPVVPNRTAAPAKKKNETAVAPAKNNRTGAAGREAPGE